MTPIQKSLKARVYDFNEKNVYCDVLLDEEKQIFEKRVFNRIMFALVPDLKFGALVYVVWTVQPGESTCKIIVPDESNPIDERLFEVDWSDIADHPMFKLEKESA